VSKDDMSTYNVEIPDSELRTLNFELRGSRGIALIMVLWVIAILSVVVLEFCFAMRTEVNVTKNFRDELQSYALAQGQVQRAITELIYRHDLRIQQMRKNLKPEEVPPEKREWITDGRPYLLPSGQEACEVRIMGEAGKVNINSVSEKTLRKIIGQLGLEVEKRDIVVDSILDWRDPDDLYRVNGAENDYYQSLKEPYNCKNGNLDTVEELLLVKGVTLDLFYGRKGGKAEEGAKNDRIGLKDVFSIYSPGEQVDINSAALPVLRVVLGLPIEIAQQIVKAREEKNFQNQPDLLQKVPELSSFMGEIGNLIVFQSTIPYYTIESRAKNKEGRTIQGLKVVVKIDEKEKTGYKVIQWVDALF
jgi:general secretion pathway protein K